MGYIMELHILKKGINKQLTKNFNSSEFECSCSRCKEVKIDMDHVRKLQKLRDDLGAAIHITSGYRCPEHNEEIGGAENSQHKYGTATDIKVSGMDASEVADACEHFNGLGRYDTFTHVDSRTSKARWDNRTKKEYLPPEPTEDDINSILDDLEDEILR